MRKSLSRLFWRIFSHFRNIWKAQSSPRRILLFFSIWKFSPFSPYIENCNSFGSRVHVVHVQQDFMEIRHSSMFRLETRDGSKDALLELSLVAQFMICVDFVQFQFILALSQWSDKRQNKRTFFFSFFFCFSTEAFRRRRCRSGKLLFYISFNTIRKLKGEKRKGTISKQKTQKASEDFVCSPFPL